MRWLALFALALGLAGCGSSTSPSPSLSPAATATSTATQLPSHNITLTLAGDVTLNQTYPSLTDCGIANGGWGAAAVGPPLFALAVPSYMGPGPYQLGSGHGPLAVVSGVSAPQGQVSLITESGTVTIDDNGSHAHFAAAAGINHVNADGTQSQTGSIQMTVDIHC
jgi:hypothetical protein